MLFMLITFIVPLLAFRRHSLTRSGPEDTTWPVNLSARTPVARNERGGHSRHLHKRAGRRRNVRSACEAPSRANFHDQLTGRLLVEFPINMLLGKKPGGVGGVLHRGLGQTLATNVQSDHPTRAPTLVIYISASAYSLRKLSIFANSAQCAECVPMLSILRL